MSKRFTIAIAVFALGLASACFTPSVPIPPPQPEEMAFTIDPDNNLVRYSSQPNASYAGAVVYVFNRSAGQGVIVTAEADGSVSPTPPFPGADGDHVIVSYELDTQLTAVCLVLHDGPSSSQYECDP